MHHQTEALSMADRILVLRAGQRQQLAAPHTLYHTPANEFVARFIGSAPMNFLPVLPAGQLSMLQLVSIFSRARLLCSNRSGVKYSCRSRAVHPCSRSWYQPPVCALPTHLHGSTSARDRTVFSTHTLGWHSCSVERDRPGRQS